MIYFKSPSLLMFFLASIVSMINEFIAGYKTTGIVVFHNPHELIFAWYSSNPLWLVILWAVSGIIVFSLYIVSSMLAAK